MMRIINIAAGAACCMLCALAAACSQQNNTAPALRLGYLQNDLHHLPAFVALEKGYFKDEGLEVQTAGAFKAGPEEMSAFGARELDIGYVGQAPATAAVLNGVADVKFIAQVNLEGSSIVAGKDSSDENLFSLAGKTVAIPGHATMQDFLLRKALAKNNIKISELKIIVLKPPEMLQALNLKNIDAFIAWEPYPAQAVNNNTGKIILSSGEIQENHPCCVLVASAELCAKSPEIIKKTQAVHRRACGYIENNRNEAIEIGSKYTGMDRETVSRALSGIKYRFELDRRKGAEFVDFLKDLRYVKPQNLDKKLSALYEFAEN